MAYPQKFQSYLFDPIKNSIEKIRDIPISKLKCKSDVNSFLKEIRMSAKLRSMISDSVILSDQSIYDWTFDIKEIVKSFDALQSFPTSLLNNKFQGECLVIRADPRRSSYIEDKDTLSSSSLKECFPRIRFTEPVPGSGHWIHAELPDLTAKLIAQVILQYY